MSARPDATCDLEVSGTLLANAEARHRMLDGDGHTVPVLLFSIELDNELHTIADVAQDFPMGQEQACEKRARELRKGTHVSVQYNVYAARLSIRCAAHVNVLREPAPATTTEAAHA